MAGPPVRATIDAREAGLFVGDSAMAALMRQVDWAGTDIGPTNGWPQSLRTALSICLESRFPILIWWGPQLVKLYNDAYRPILGDKHPRALGQRGAECWSEIWDVIGPMLDSVVRDGAATWSEDQLLLMDRRGFTEETYFTFSYSPIRDESGGVGGIFTAVTETTDRVIRERRLAALRDLAIDAHEATEAAAMAIEVLAGAAADVPFAVFWPAAGRPVATPNVDAAGDGPPRGAPDGTCRRVPVGDLGGLRLGEQPAGPPREAIVLPVDRPGHDEPFGTLVLGLSPRLAVDGEYEDFLNLVAANLSTAMANAEAFDEQRRRAEALAEIDRAKTAFFTNISHEFRTPLTLLLGPLAQILERDALSPADRADVGVAARNARRLLRLVNTLLEFSRIEAGRVEAWYEPTDLASLTAGVASTFRSAFEQAGIELRVETHPIDAETLVDRGMWERVLLNLLSNALKFTLDGEVAVELRRAADEAVLTVRDTGEGIPADELPRVFERFHRIEQTRSRSHEGTGIGLALAAELVALHGGRIDVTSAVGKGSTFTVRLPLGRAHLPPERIRERATAPDAPPAALRDDGTVEEALSWLANGSDDRAPNAPDGRAAGTVGGRVLVVDDNADMRAYVQRVLAPRFEVDLAADGDDALRRLRSSPPDLVLADVMMPRTDGIGLLRAIRADPRLRTLPVILLSARAGPGAQREALALGADDYLVKPFAAEDLAARVAAHLSIARLRDEVVAQLRTSEQELRAALAAKDDFLGMVSHELRTPLTTILGHARLLAAPGRAIEADLFHDEIGDIRLEAERLNGIIDNLLMVARLDAGYVPEFEPLLVDRLVERVLARHREQLDREIVHRPAASAPSVEASSGYVEQLLTNLLSNAIKYSPPGAPIEVSGHVLDGAFVVEVADRGVGVDPAEVDRLFEPFYRSDRTQSRAGIGIGLAVCRRLVEAMGGWLRAEARAGGGSVFSFGLPLAHVDDDGSAPTPVEPAATAPGRPSTTTR